MFCYRVISSIMLGAALLVSLPAHAQTEDEVDARIEDLLGSAETFRSAFEVLQFAVQGQDAATVAALVNYPLTVRLAGERVTLHDEADFVARYNELIDEDVAQVILEQDYAQLFVNSDGVMFGNGEIWLNAHCTDRSCEVTYWLINAINRAE